MADSGKQGVRPTAVVLWLLFGLALGVGLGLAYAWLVAPVEFVDATPAELSASDQAAYIALVSAGFARDGDLARAQARLAALERPDAAEAVGDALETAVRDQQPPSTIRQLAGLARALGVRNATVAAFAPANIDAPAQDENDTRQPAATAVAPAQPLPTLTPSPIDPTQATVRLIAQERLCDPAAAQLEVELLDALRTPLAGVEIEVAWPGGRDRFFTGLKPARGAGYADFTMQPDVVYTVTISSGGARVDNLQLEPCDSGEWGGVRLTFQRLSG